jgi:hypothetical protein
MFNKIMWTNSVTYFCPRASSTEFGKDIIIIHTIQISSGSVIFLPSFIKIFNKFLIFNTFLNKLNCCNINITKGNKLLIRPLRWAQVE